MTLFDDLIPLKQQLITQIPLELGHPDYAAISVTHDSKTEYFTVQITNITFSQQNWLAAAGVRVNSDMIGIANIPRYLELDFLRQGIWSLRSETYRATSVYLGDSLTFRAILNKVRNR